MLKKLMNATNIINYLQYWVQPKVFLIFTLTVHPKSTLLLPQVDLPRWQITCAFAFHGNFIIELHSSYTQK